MTICSRSFKLPPCLSFILSLSRIPVNIRTQAPNVEPPSSLPVLCLPTPLPGCTLDRYQSLPLSPTSLTSPLLSSNPLPQLTLTLNSFKSAPSLLIPTSNAPFPCTLPQLPLPLHPSSSFLCSLNPSHPRPPSLPRPLPHLFSHSRWIRRGVSRASQAARSQRDGGGD